MRNTTRVMKQDLSSEQRRGPRFVCEAPITFEGEGRSGKGTTYNVSAWGCAVESPVDVLPGMYVGVNLLLPDHAKPVLVELAAVRWTAPRKFGVEFLSLSRTSRRRLEHFLESQAEYARA
ncbi:PilZ domain-containing protein [Candidatus Nitrospira bockiana]